MLGPQSGKHVAHVAAPALERGQRDRLETGAVSAGVHLEIPGHLVAALVQGLLGLATNRFLRRSGRDDSGTAPTPAVQG